MDVLIFWVIIVVIWLIVRAVKNQPHFESAPTTSSSTIKPTMNVQQTLLDGCQSSADSLPLYRDLTMQQKMNLFALLAFMAGFAQTNHSRSECTKMVQITAVCLGLDIEKSICYIAKYSKDADALIDSVIAIPNQQVKEMFLCNCFYFAKETNHPDALLMLIGMAKEMGYTLGDVESLVQEKEEQLGMA